MLPASPRPLGLPTSTRPHRSPNSAARSPFQTPSGLPPLAPERTHSRRPANPASSHSRSRSQPPRLVSSPRHNRSASTAPASDEQSEIRTPIRENNRARAPSNRQYSDSEHSTPPVSQDTQTKTAYDRPAARKATIDESSGDGYAIWNAVSSVASALTVSVSKAWSTNIPTFSGEETPPGQESRLTRAMKAYHIAKARDPSDLPAWLFDERERRDVDATASRDEMPNSGGQTPFAWGVTATTASSERRTAVSTSVQSTPPQPRLRGTDRLKAMREAKRGIGEYASSGDFGDNNRQSSRIREASTQPQPAAIQQPRIGLPSGPQRGRR